MTIGAIYISLSEVKFLGLRLTHKPCESICQGCFHSSRTLTEVGGLKMMRYRYLGLSMKLCMFASMLDELIAAPTSSHLAQHKVLVLNLCSVCHPIAVPLDFTYARSQQYACRPIAAFRRLDINLFFRSSFEAKGEALAALGLSLL